MADSAPRRPPRARGRTRASLAVLALCPVLFLTLVPPAGAAPAVVGIRIGPAYHTQCYGTQEGTAVAYNFGSTTGGVWNNTFANGSLALPSQQASAVGTGSSGYRALGWISMGPGPTSGLCFTPPGSSGRVHFTFSNLTYRVALRASCGPGDLGSANASYNLTLEGNIYDLSTATFVWTSLPNLATTFATHSVNCTGGSARYVHTFTSRKSILVSGNTSSFSPYDRYWFIVDIDLITTADASGSGTKATASVSEVSADLSRIDCRGC